MHPRACPATRDLLALYRSPGDATALSAARWAGVLGATRRSRTLGHLGLALRLGAGTSGLDARVATHLASSATLIAYRRRQLRRELVALDRALAGVDAPIVLLKGAAYDALDLPLAAARLPGDVDLLVPAARLADVEAALRQAGYAPAPLDPHDERYYREWSHELPPFSHPERAVEVDVHHAITPAMRGPGVDPTPLLADSVALDGRFARFRALSPVDRLIHCALHTFKDSDLSLRLRESMDFDLLYRHHRTALPELDAALAARAVALGQARPVWWALHFARRWLGTPVGDAALRGMPAPSRVAVAAMEALCDRAMLPGLRQRRGGLDALAAVALLARYHARRLPLSKLVPHLIVKSGRRLRPSARNRLETRN